MALFFRIERPAKAESYWETVGHNFPLLFIAGAVLLIAYLFPIEKYPFGFCVFRHLTGIPCPTCGFTRAFCALANGDWIAGLHNCPFALILFVLTALIFIYNAAAAVAALFGFRLQRGPWLQLSKGKIIYISVFCAFLLAVNWVYRLMLGLR